MAKPRGKVRASDRRTREASRPGIAETAINRKLLDLIRHQEEVKEELTLSRDKFEDIFSKSPIGIELFSLSGDVIESNHACKTIFGNDPNSKWVDYNILKDPKLPSHVRQALKRKRGIRFEMAYPIIKSGEIKNHILDCFISVLRTGAKPYAFLCQIQDVTKQKETEKQLTQAKKNLEDEVARRTEELINANAMLRKELASHKVLEEQLKRQQSWLIESQDRYRALYLHSPYPSFVIQDWKFVNGNSAALQLFGGTSPKQLQDKPLMDFIHPDFRDIVRKRIEQTLEKGSAPSLEIKVRKLDGTVIDVESKRSYITYKGKPAVLSMLRDITERKRNQVLLEATSKLFALHNQSRSSKEYISAIVRQLKDWCRCESAGIRLDGRLSAYDCNDGFPERYWKSLIGHERGDCVCTLAKEKKLEKAIPELHHDGSYIRHDKTGHMRGRCSRGFATMAIIPITHQGKAIGAIHLADRNPGKFVRYSVMPYRNVAELIGNSLTEMSYEEELHDKNELLEKFFDSMGLSIAYIDKDLRFIKVNRMYAETNGHEPEYFVGKTHESLFAQYKDQREIFKEVLRTGIPFNAYAKPMPDKLHPDRPTAYWDWNVQRVENHEDGSHDLLLSLQNVTERHQTEERLLESYKHLGIINRKVAILLDLNKLHGGKETGNIMQFIVNSALKLSQAKCVTFYEYKREGDLFKLRCHSGNGGGRHPEILPTKNCTMLKQLVKKKVRVQGAFDQKDHGCPKELKPNAYHLFLPIIIRNQLKGCMHFEFSKRGFVTTQELDFYEAFTNNAASALEKIKLFRNPQQMKLDFEGEPISVRTADTLSFGD